MLHCTASAILVEVQHTSISSVLSVWYFIDLETRFAHLCGILVIRPQVGGEVQTSWRFI